MTKNDIKHPRGYWIAIGIATRRIHDGQSITVDGGAALCL